MRKPLSIQKLYATNYGNTFHTSILWSMNERYVDERYIDLWKYKFFDISLWLHIILTKCCNGSGRAAVCKLSNFSMNLPYSILFVEVL